MNWIPIKSQEAELLYGVPADIANNPENAFFGTPMDLPQEYDLSRPFLAFLSSSENPSVVTFHVQTIEPETWELRGMLPNPLTMEGGILSLGSAGLKGLLEILSSYQDRFSSQTKQRRQMFKTIKNSQLDEFRLHPDWFPNTRQEHYIQIYDPITNREESSITILVLSNSPGSGKINMKIRHFSSHALKELSFQPLDRGLSRINLDKNGIHEFIGILQGQLRYI